MTKRALLLGGTGAMGVYLAPELVSLGFDVDVTSRSERKDKHPQIKYLQGDAHDEAFLTRTLGAEKYDVIVDFMVYSTEEFKRRCKPLLDSTAHYIYLSSYRVFADADVITERTPRLLDISADKDFLETDEYALAKARQEDILRSSRRRNWTIVRPAITYSKDRFQLGTLEADLVVWRALHHKPTAIPRDMLEKTTTMTWAGDVARLIARLALNKRALGEDFNVSTNEHHTWSEVAQVYADVIGLKVVPVGIDAYIEALGGGYNAYQVKYDRLYDRILDNSKVLRVTGMKQSDLTSLSEGLTHELESFLKHPFFSFIDYAKQARMDKLTNTVTDIRDLSTAEKREYIKNRFPAIAKGAHHTRIGVTKIRSKARVRTRIREMKLQTDAVKEQKRIKVEKERLKKQHYQENREYLKSDGAILTLPGYFNYGNLLQRFALQRFLKLHGHTFVSYVKDMPIETEADAKRFTYTYDFVKRNIWHRLYDPRDEFKAYIVGSDQVWRNWTYDDVYVSLGYFFLDFTRDMKTKRIAYAASFGQDTLEGALIDEEFAEYVKPVVQSFAAIGMRETSGVALVKKEWGMDAAQVVDPTLLLKAKDYDRLIKAAPYSLKEVKPIFTYFILMSDSKRGMMDKICNAAGLERDGIYLDGSSEQLPPVEYWIKGIRDSELLVTDSFHGVVFAILYNTSFIVLESGTGGAGRTATLLGALGLEDRYVTSDRIESFNVDALKPIDWRAVNKKVSTMRKQSAKWLLRAVRSRSGIKTVDTPSTNPN